MTTIAFVRHGITDWNVEGRVQGHTDIPLNGRGRRQARALAERLQNEAWDHIYSSDLSRARETAEIIAETLGLGVTTDQRLREMACGAVEGTTAEERMAKWGSNWKSLSLDVESRESMVARGTAFITDLLGHHGDARIIVVSHAGLLRLTLGALVPEVIARGGLENTSLTRLEGTNGNWVCPLYNCAKHLD